MNYEAIKPFCQLYVKFIDDLSKLYATGVSKEKLATQKKWLLTCMLKKKTDIPDVFLKSILPYANMIHAGSYDLFDPSHKMCLKLGRIDFRVFSGCVAYDALQDTDKEIILRYLKSLLLTSQMLTGSLNMAEFDAYLKGQQQQQQQVQAQHTTPAADPFADFMQTPAFAGVYSKLESKLSVLAEQKGINLNNKSELMSMMFSGQVDIGSMMKEVSTDLEREIRDGNVDRKELEAQASSLLSSVDPTMLSLVQSNPSMLMSMFAGGQAR